MVTTDTIDQYKVVVVGEALVGKSAITIQFIKGHFVTDPDPTIEDSYRKQCVIDGNASILDILDTAPHEDSSVMREQCIKSGEAFLLVYSVTNKHSFNIIHKYHKQILQVKDSDTVPMMLVANKTDIKTERVVSSQDGEELSKILKVGYIETSAKLGSNIEKAFYDLVRYIRKMRSDELGLPNDVITEEQRRKKCTIS